MVGGEKSAVFVFADVSMSKKEFEEAFSDEAFVQELLNLKTGEQVKKALEKKGVFLTPDEFDKFAKVLLEVWEKNKLSDNNLKNFSGGTKDDVKICAEILAKFVNPEAFKNSDGFFANLIIGNNE